jgi:hypothetical protein
VTPRATGSPEDCTRLAAVEAGWRFAGHHPGETFLLQHSGAEGNRWQLRAHSLDRGVVVAEFKARRQQVVHGAVALWANGQVRRYETADDLHQTGTG